MSSYDDLFIPQGGRSPPKRHALGVLDLLPATHSHHSLTPEKGRAMKKDFRPLLIILQLSVAVSAFAQEYTNVRVTNNQEDQSESAIAISPLSVLNQMVVFNDYQDEQMVPEPGYAFSTNAGQDWSLGILGNITVPPPWNLLDYGFNQSVGFDRYGYAYYCYVATNTAEPNLGSIYVSRTSDFGDSWSHGWVSSNPAFYLLQEKPFMSIDNNTGPGFGGRVYVTWTNTQFENQILFSYSTDHGETFEPSVVLAEGSLVHPYLSSAPKSTPIQNPEINEDFVEGAVSVVDLSGALHVIWTRASGTGAGSDATIEYRSSTDGGQTFNPPLSQMPRSLSE